MPPRRTNRPYRDWVKGERKRPRGIDADDETVRTGHEGMRPKGITLASRSEEGEESGQVIAARSGRYDIQLEGEEGAILRCQIKRGITTDNPNTTLVAIGDRVKLQRVNTEEGVITHVLERVSHLGRTKSADKGVEHIIAANVDLLLCTTAADRPDFRRTIIDRFIVAALLGDIQPIIIVNKIDTANQEIREILEEELSVYPPLGYPVLMLSAQSGEGMDELQRQLVGKTAVLAGQSGVGKSTLMNVLVGTEQRRTAEVRDSDRRGVHTTVDSVLHQLPTAGRLIDTPGIREFGIWDLRPEELDGYFVEFLDHLRDCRFHPCTHTHEPGCAVQLAVESGSIDPGRYASYRAIFESLRSTRDR
ncbi:MAG: ribosome small subunit-dependent GTPase A [Chlorobi bacterium CHB2]|nr:ribosome small subunit-dependent GTPase A [Chlorobi bacterium CHB2]